MSKLLEHFKAMQAMASNYLEPTVYTSPTTGAQANESESDRLRRDRLFTADVIHMLDGPEQRDAQAEAEQRDEVYDANVKALTEDLGRLRERCEQRGTVNKQLEADNNDLRTRLFDSELAYAKLLGYVGRIEDERPAELVPAPRARFIDGGQPGVSAYNIASNYGYAGDRSQKRWFHR